MTGVSGVTDARPGVFGKRAMSLSQSSNGNAAYEDAPMAPQESEAPFGAQGINVPWVTFALLALLIAVFVAEQNYAIGPVGPSRSPGLQTLIAFGGLNRSLVAGGEWYRLFTAPLLHADFFHILGNGIALLFAGFALEGLVGRAWYFALFVVGAMGGALMSLAVNPDTMTSVGASGAIMGLFAALWFFSYRLPEESPARRRLQRLALRVLIPSLLPLATSGTGGHVDYGAHLGGALGSGVLALFLIQTWPEEMRFPSYREFAALIGLTGVFLASTSMIMTAAGFPKYETAVSLIPQQEIPKTTPDALAHAADLAAKYPQDPRAHLLLGVVKLQGRDYFGGEAEARLGLQQVEPLRLLLGPKVALSLRGLLVAALVAEGRKDEAKAAAGDFCQSPADNAPAFRDLLATAHLCD
jgi:rhomboid protease GluP